MADNDSKILVISGSSHRDGATDKLVEALISDTDAIHMRIIDYSVSFFDYEYKNKDDDFKLFSQKMLEADHIIFATPVYWYAMGAPMKILFDRMSDLITARKEQGRALKGKSIWMMANGSGESLPEGFEVPFRDTAKYFDMPYKGHHYHYTGETNPALAQQCEAAFITFKQEIFTS